MWAIVLPPAINTFNMIIMRTFFQGIPDSLQESAHLDGANDLQILVRIILPLSRAIIATLILFYSVSHWNSFFPALIFLNVNMSAYVLRYTENLYVCILNANDLERVILDSFIENIIKAFEFDRQYMDITIGVGNFFLGLDGISNSFNKSMTAISRKTADNKAQVIYSDDLSIDKSFYYYFIDEQKILNCIKASDVQSLYSIIGDIFIKNIEIEVSYESVIKLYKELYYTGIRFISEVGLNVDQAVINEVNLLENRRGFIVIDELKNSLLDFYSKIISINTNINQNNTNHLISLINDYIKSNYDKDLYLDRIADELSVSQNIYLEYLRKKLVSISQIILIF